MPPPSLQIRTSGVWMLLVLSGLVALLSDAASGETVVPPSPRGKCGEASVSCALFQSLSSFPFGFTPGCGHPAFQINCSADGRPQMSICGSSFSILDQRGDSLRISPVHDSSLVSSSVPPQIDLSGTPFRFAEESCSSIAAVHPCESELGHLHSNCNATDAGRTASTWEACILSWPPHLLKGCNISHHLRPNSSNHERCRLDLLANITELLRNGIWIEWHLAEDSYFSKCSSCRSKHEACGFDVSDPIHPFLCLAGGNHRRFHRIILFTSCLLALTCLSVLAFLAAIIFRRGFGSGGSRWHGGETTMAAFFRRHRLHLQAPVFTYEQLSTSTGGFDPKRKIGDGGFGSVYLGHLEDGRSVAVKRLHCRHRSATANSFCNEILILSSIHHPNLVRLHGYCCDPRGLLLVYDYVPNGTLADHLHRKGQLPWDLRLSIALQTAVALEYLHFSVKPAVVHRDITSSNIFIDKDMKIKLGDFGLSRLLCLPDRSTTSSGSASSEHVWTGPQGTPGYLDPDYHISFRLTEKSDVYSFGVVLLELVTGMKAVDLGRDKQEISLANFAVSKIQVGALQEVIDPVFRRHGQTMGAIEAVAELAFRCVAGERDDRPNTRELVTELKRIQNQLREESQ